MGFIEGMEKMTNSTVFLLRGIRQVIGELEEVGFLNAYIDDVHHEPHYKKAVYLLFKPESMDYFRAYLMKEQDRHSMILEDYDYEGGYVVIVFGFPEEFHQEYDNFIDGKFSLFRTRYAKLFPMEVLGRTKGLGSIVKNKSIYHHVFNRSAELKEHWETEIGVELDEEMEYWSRPDIDKETLDINKIRQKEDE